MSATTKAMEVGYRVFLDRPGQPESAITMQEAARIVQTQYPIARILEMEWDTEDGRLVYEIELVTAEGQKK